MNPFAIVPPIPIKNLPTSWIVVGDPIRARDIAHKHFKCPSKPLFSDGYTSIWICRSQNETFGIMSAGMGRPSVLYSLSRVPVDVVVRIGTCGYHKTEHKSQIVNVNICYNDSTNVVYGIEHSTFPNVSCLSTDLLYSNRPVSTDVEDMESFAVLGYTNSASLLFCVNKIYVRENIEYTNDIFYTIADAAVDIIKDLKNRRTSCPYQQAAR